jgi:hypothetical protein
MLNKYSDDTVGHDPNKYINNISNVIILLLKDKYY